ncbi:MAG: hypothetical protein R2708_04715 [Vicinamibacterales bacterium]
MGALTAFLLLHLSVVGYFVARRRAASGPWHRLVPAAGVAVIAWVLVEASPVAQAVGAGWFALGLAVWAGVGRRG